MRRSAVFYAALPHRRRRVDRDNPALQSPGEYE